MKKFVILFLLLTLSFPVPTFAAETLTPEVVLTQLVEITPIPVDLNVQTFAIDLTDPEIVITSLIPKNELHCLQQNIYFEARGQGMRGMSAIANVTMHRTKDARYPSSVCGVVHQQSKGICQFSWVCTKGKSARPRSKTEELAAWHTAGEIAARALQGTLTDVVHGATHFHNTAANPSWARRLKQTIQIGTHIFYR